MSSVPELQALVLRLESAVARLESSGVLPKEGGGSTLPSPSSSGAKKPQWMQDFEERVMEQAKKMDGLAEATGVEEVRSSCRLLSASMTFLRKLLCATARAKKPADAEWPAVLEEPMKYAKEAKNLLNHRSDFFPHQQVVVEACNLCCSPMSPSPSDFVEMQMEAMDYQANKVLMRKKDSESAWVRSLKDMGKNLREFYKECLPDGIRWAPPSSALPLIQLIKEGEDQEKKRPDKVKGKGKGKGKGAPPPPSTHRPPPADLFAKTEEKGEKGGMSAVFEQINGGGVALKKVSDDMKTKNRLKTEAGFIVPSGKSKTEPEEKRKPRAAPKKAPSCSLHRDTWQVSHFSDGEVKLGETDRELEMRHLVYVSDSSRTRIILSKKAKSVVLDSCVDCLVLVHSVVSTVELINCRKIKLQTLEKVPGVSIDQCSGVNLYLSPESLDCCITTSKSCEMNVNIPISSDGDYRELPLPEQYVHKLSAPTDPTSSAISTDVSSLYA